MLSSGVSLYRTPASLCNYLERSFIEIRNLHRDDLLLIGFGLNYCRGRFRAEETGFWEANIDFLIHREGGPHLLNISMGQSTCEPAEVAAKSIDLP